MCRFSYFAPPLKFSIPIIWGCFLKKNFLVQTCLFLWIPYFFKDLIEILILSSLICGEQNLIFVAGIW